MAKSHVLVVEDDKLLADVLAYNLDQTGYDISVARDGQDGLRQTEVKLPDVILLDLMLPVVDGLDLYRRLRANAVTRDMFIVMLTPSRKNPTKWLASLLAGTITSTNLSAFAS